MAGDLIEFIKKLHLFSFYKEFIVVIKQFFLTILNLMLVQLKSV